MFKYDVTLSFAGEERSYAEEIAQILKNQHIKVFYDYFEISKLWGKDLYQYLQSVYKDQALYCVIFFSKNYLKKSWTRHELKQAQERAFSENREYILPVVMDIDLDDIPGMNTTTGYIDYNNFSPEEIAKLIIDKINQSHNLVENNYLKVKFHNITSNILFKEIIYIESISPLISIQTISKEFITYLKLSSIVPVLPDNFIRIHCSYIVNKDYIQSVCSKYVTLTNGKELPVSRSYNKSVKEIFKQSILSQ